MNNDHLQYIKKKGCLERPALIKWFPKAGQMEEATLVKAIDNIQRDLDKLKMLSAIPVEEFTLSRHKDYKRIIKSIEKRCQQCINVCMLMTTEYRHMRIKEVIEEGKELPKWLKVYNTYLNRLKTRLGVVETALKKKSCRYKWLMETNREPYPWFIQAVQKLNLEREALLKEIALREEKDKNMAWEDSNDFFR